MRRRYGVGSAHALWEDAITASATDNTSVACGRDGPAIVVAAGAPFDFLKALTALDLSGLHQPSERLDATRLRLPVDLGDRTLAVDVTARGTPQRPEVVVAAVGGDRILDDEAPALIRALDHVLGVSEELGGFVAIAREDAPFWRTAGTLEGLHRIGFATPLEGICWTILRQRQYPNVARARLRRLRERFGRPATNDPEHASFPRASSLAALSIEAIRREVKSRKKARYLREAATAFASWGDDLDVLNDPPEDIEARLKTIRGVGPWSARTFVARAFQRPHLGQVLDQGALTPYWRDVLARFYGPDPTPELVRERADAYGRWEGTWLNYARFTHHAMQRAAAGEVDV